MVLFFSPDLALAFHWDIKQQNGPHTPPTQVVDLIPQGFLGRPAVVPINPICKRPPPPPTTLRSGKRVVPSQWYTSDQKWCWCQIIFCLSLNAVSMFVYRNIPVFVLSYEFHSMKSVDSSPYQRSQALNVKSGNVSSWITASCLARVNLFFGSFDSVSPHDPNIAEMDECNPKSNKYLDDSLGRRAELWFECTLHTERWSYAIGGNMVRWKSPE